MKDEELVGLEQMRAFLEGSEEVRFRAGNRRELYGWTERILRARNYPDLCKTEKGLVRRFVAKVTGLSRAQTARLIGQYADDGCLTLRRGQGKHFAAIYTLADIALLAEVNEAHEILSGPATQKILYRAYYEFADPPHERLANISTAHIYNLRKQKGYREKRLHFEKTRPTPVSIGERRRPRPEGRAGYLRVDTVHQGDLDGVKGVYYINAVDEVTQWEIVGAVAHISEAWLRPLLEAMLAQFPFPNINEFCREQLNPYLNYHRPCGVPESKTDRKGKIRRFYRWYATPFEILRQLPGQRLREDLTMEQLEQTAGKQSDTGAALEMQTAKRKLFASFEERKIA